MAEDTYKEKWRDELDFPEDRTNIAPALALLETYSGIPPDEITPHVLAVREKAFSIFHYPCIGRWRFLDIYIRTTPEYKTIIERLKSGGTLLEVACCFGQILRQLVADGAPAKSLAGTDLRPEFIELGYELFRDRQQLDAEFVAGDIFDASSLRTLDGRFDVIHVARFFHLFGWDEQVEAGVRIVKFLRPGSRPLIVGRQVGTRDPADLRRGAGGLGYLHNLESFQELWDVIGARTGSQWKVTGELVDSHFDEVPRVLLRFAIFAL